MWTEIAVDTLSRLGHRVVFGYHNRRQPRDRLALLGSRIMHPNQDRAAAWSERYQWHLLERMQGVSWDILLSIQGRVSADTIRQLRKTSPALKVVFWWGDIMTGQAARRVHAAAEFSDRILVSYQGVYETLSSTYGEKTVYFPFGVSTRFHHPPEPGWLDRRRFGADLAFVGTCYPERCELIRYLNARLGKPVRVWGRGWRRCKGVWGHGALSLADTLKVHAASRVSLNLHHRGTSNGFNMKFYEIPAARGFQLCDWQPALEKSVLGARTVSCRTLAEFADRASYYLEHENERRDIIEQTSTIVFATEDYRPRFERLLGSLT